MLNSYFRTSTWVKFIGGSAYIWNLYSYVTSSGDIRYDNLSYAAFAQ